MRLAQATPWFIGLPPAATAATALFLVAPQAIVPLWWAWTWLIEGPHLVATWMRTYADAHERGARGRLLAGSFAWFLPGFAAFALARTNGEATPFVAFLGFAALWSWHHTARQHFGIMSLLARQGRTPRAWFRVDKTFIYLGAWLAFGLSLLRHQSNRRLLGIPEDLAGSAQLMVELLGAFVLVYAAHVVWRLWTRTAPAPALFSLSVIGAMHFVLFFVFGRFEPMLPGLPAEATPEQLFAATTIAAGAVHGLQYLLLYFVVEERRATLTPRGGWIDALARAPWRAWGAFALVSVAYFALSGARGGAPGLSFFSLESDAARLSMAAYWGLFFHHYYLDQHIWRPHKDSRLRAELGFSA